MSSSLPSIHYNILEKKSIRGTRDAPVLDFKRFQLSLVLHIINVVEQILWYTCKGLFTLAVFIKTTRFLFNIV